MRSAFIIILYVILGPQLDVHASAEDNRCGAELRQCFELKEPARSECFYKVSKLSTCTNSQLGKLASRRWLMTPDRTANIEARAAFSNTLVDMNCVKKFDYQLSATLVAQDLGSTNLENLMQHLLTCEKTISDELLRP